MPALVNQFATGTNFYVAWAVETGTITESTDNIAPASLPSAPNFNTASYIGYTDVPERNFGLNNSQGYGIGSRSPLYNKKGRPQPNFTLPLRGGSWAILNQSIAVNGVLPSLCVWMGVPGVWCDTYRFCNLDQVVMNMRASQGEATEVEGQLDFVALCRVPLSSLPSINASTEVSLGTPLFFHSFRNFAIGDTSATYTDYRLWVESLSVTLQNRSGYHGNRPAYTGGDSVPLSRCAVTLHAHTVGVSGQVQFNGRLPEDYFTAAATSLDWANIQCFITNSPNGGGEMIPLTLYNAIPSTATDNAADHDGLQMQTIPFVASNWSFLYGSYSGAGSTDTGDGFSNA